MGTVVAEQGVGIPAFLSPFPPCLLSEALLGGWSLGISGRGWAGHSLARPIVCEAWAGARDSSTGPFVTHQILWWPPVLTSSKLKAMSWRQIFLPGPGCDVTVEGAGEAGVNGGGLLGWLRADKLPLALKAQQLPAH